MYSIRNESKKINARDRANSTAVPSSVCEKMQSTGLPTKLFDKKFVATTLRNAHCCPKCRNEYSTNYDHRLGDVHVKSNRPFLLTCGHNMCENCIYQNHQHLICSICQIPILIEPPNQQNNYIRNDNFNVRDFFYMNFFLLGELNHLRFYRRESSANNTLMVSTSHGPHPSNSGNRTLAPIAALPAPAIIRCTECELEPAMGLCRQCSVHYCRVCYDSIHMYGKALKKHTFVALESHRFGAGRDRMMPRPVSCRQHHRVKDRYCRTCRVVCCGLCAKVEHPNHRWVLLAKENENMKDEIVTLLDSVKTSRENLRKAQKDIKTVETQLEEYSTQCIKDISDYFLQLHSFLQNEEHRILDDLQKKCMTPQRTIRDAASKLNESQDVLHKMRRDLELYQQNVPTDINLRNLFDIYNTQIERMECRVQISKLNESPFSFEVKGDLRKDFSQLYTYSYTDPCIKIRLAPIYSELNQTFRDMKTDTSDEMDVDCYTEKHKRKNNERNKKKKQAQQRRNDNEDTSQHKNSTSEAETQDPRVHDKDLVRISYVKSPEHFFVQTKNGVHQIRELSNKYVNFMQTDVIPKTIDEGQCYMIYHSNDKQWYRAMVKKALPNDLYKVFLVDIGMQVEMPKERFCEMDTKSLSVPFAAIRCAINDIMPTGKAWNEEANNLLIEITRNRYVRISIIDRIKENVLSIDLFANELEDTISVRDSFLYTGLARERSGVGNMPSPLKKLSPVARTNQRFPKHTFHNGDLLLVKVTYIENPELFYVVKMDSIESAQVVKADLNCRYKNSKSPMQPIFVAPLQMCCAVLIEDKWHRARVEEIRGGGKVLVHLVDEGSQQEVGWRQIFQLSNRFRSQKEFAVKCALAGVEPLQEKNYSWTTEAIREFAQFTANPTLQMTIISTNSTITRVALHVCKKHIDINIGAMLVKYGHCTSTDESSQVVEVYKTSKKRLSLPMNPLTDLEPMSGEMRPKDMSLQAGNPQANSAATATQSSNQVKLLKRTPVKVVHIIDPGEFYIQISSLTTGITKFHYQLQQAQAEVQANTSSFSISSQSGSKKWFVGNHCLVYTKFRSALSKIKSQSQCEWYRAIIISIASEIDGDTYTVFLRDVGATIVDVTVDQLAAIDNQWDRVTNAVHRCHLACVEPTGGMLVWSHSAIDCFEHTVKSFESLSATLQGKRTPGSNSLPIVLWGTITETEDPLAPCISRHSIINRILVKAGLAHSVQRLDVTEQLDKLIQLELVEGEITMEEWNRNFAANTALKEIDRHAWNPGFNAADTDTSLKADDNGDYKKVPDMDFALDKEINRKACGEPTIFTSKAPDAWLQSKPIEKSIFAAMPTYVDYDANIYLHDALDEDLLTEIRIQIMKVFNEYPLPKDCNPTYKPGQGCLIRYHMDKRLYRGIIQEIKDDEYMVQFIDYGNVESATLQELRPFAPYPNLPAMAQKYCLEGIRPKSEDGIYSTDVLDILHATVVDKLVSIRVETTELSKPIKACSMRLGNMDIAEHLINAGHVLRVSSGMQKRESDADKSKQQQNDLFEAIANISNKELTNVKADKMFDYKPIKRTTDQHDEDDTEMEQNLYDDDNDDTVNDCLDQLIYNLDKDKNDLHMYSDDSIDDDLNTALSPLHAAQAAQMALHSQSHHQTFMPPCKKRMFDSNEYKQMHKQMLQENLYGSENFMENELAAMQCDNFGGAAGAAGTSWGIGEDDEDAAVVELEQSFALNYWHTTDDERERPKIKEKQNKKEIEHALEQEAGKELLIHDSEMFALRPRQALETSMFEKFYPSETSSVFSHFSGIESFKNPQLPIGKRTFECSVVCIVTPVIVQILPHFTEFEYRELELQRRIKHLVKSAPPLTEFEPRTICLSLNQKDKKWYRALIRSHNPIAKHVDVFFVDYLNTASVPTTHLRQCPLELISWPLRTIRVRLHGLVPNPRLREKDIRQALQNVVAKRTLVARIVNEPKGGGGGGGGVDSAAIANMTDLMDPDDVADMSTTADNAIMEVELYNLNADVNNLRITRVYESLVQDSFYSYKSSV